MYGLGWKPDKPDARDQHISKLGLSSSVPLAASLASLVINLDQENTSRCVAFSWGQALRIADQVDGIAAPVLSAVDFLYFNSRKVDAPGQPVTDDGTQLRSCAKGIMRFGRPPVSAWPHSPNKINVQPDWEAYREGFDYRGPAGYYTVRSLDEIKQAIAARKPVVGGASVAASIQSYTGGIYDPDPSEPSIGGHAMCVVGYDDRCFTLINSWGQSWGESGFLRVSPAFMATFTDLWAVADQ